jgi:hypothetical protein
MRNYLKNMKSCIQSPNTPKKKRERERERDGGREEGRKEGRKKVIQMDKT